MPAPFLLKEVCRHKVIAQFLWGPGACRQAAANLLLSSDSFSKNWLITFSRVSASGMLVNLIFFFPCEKLTSWFLEGLGFKPSIFLTLTSHVHFLRSIPEMFMYVVTSVHPLGSCLCNSNHHFHSNNVHFYVLLLTVTLQSVLGHSTLKHALQVLRHPQNSLKGFEHFKEMGRGLIL